MRRTTVLVGPALLGAAMVWIVGFYRPVDSLGGISLANPLIYWALGLYTLGLGLLIASVVRKRKM